MTQHRFNTGNPLESPDPRDLMDNAHNYDRAINDLDNETWTDRLGRTRKTYSAVEKEVEGLLVAGGKIFPDEPTGRAAVEDGQYFFAESVDPDISRVLWQRIDANSSRRVAEDPDVEMVRAIAESFDVGDSPEAHTYFTDLVGQIVATLFADGKLTSHGYELGTTLAEGLRLFDTNGFFPVDIGLSGASLYGVDIEATPNDDTALVDKYGFLISGVYGGEVVQASAPGHGVARKPTPALEAAIRTAIQHIILYGQSLSIGSNGEPPISTSQPYQNVMFTSGVRIGQHGNGYNASSFAPLIEQLNDDRFGETPASGAANGITRRALESGGLEEQYKYLVTSSGRGGRRVDELVPGQPNGDWELTVRAIQDAKALCDAQGISYSVPCMLWLQGNANVWHQAEDSLPEDYIERWLGQMWTPMKDEIYRITGQANIPYMFTYQAALNPDNTDVPYIGPQTAQWRASMTYDDVVMFAPSYFFPRNPDDVHASNEGYWLIGEYAARAMYQTLYQRKKFRPLEPVSVAWGTSAIVLKFHVPMGSVVIDDALFPTQPSAGFEIRESYRSTNLVTGAITGAAVTGDDEVTLTLDTNVSIPDTAVLQYPQGNVRDTAGLWDKATSPLGNEFALHNALVTFHYSRKFGF